MHVPIGLAFFIWTGLVNVVLVAQLWSYANDLYTEDREAPGCSRSSRSAGRIDKLGLRRTLHVMPIIALGAYGAMAAVGGSSRPIARPSRSEGRAASASTAAVWLR